MNPHTVFKIYGKPLSFSCLFTLCPHNVLLSERERMGGKEGGRVHDAVCPTMTFYFELLCAQHPPSPRRIRNLEWEETLVDISIIILTTLLPHCNQPFCLPGVLLTIKGITQRNACSVENLTEKSIKRQEKEDRISLSE